MTSKAQAFALAAEGSGWSVERIKGKKNPLSRRVIAARGAERFTMTWTREAEGGRERFVGGTHGVGTDEQPVRSVREAAEALASPPKVAHKDETGFVSRLPYDPDTSTDAEILTAVAGRQISWRNRVSGQIETAGVPRGGLHLRIERTANSRRVLTFVSTGAIGGYRSVDVACIRKVA